MEITPNPAFADEPVRVAASGFAPRQRVIVRASTEDDAGRRWVSHAEFRADAEGCVDAAAQKSLGGSYRGLSPMGLLWSMRIEPQHDRGDTIFVKNDSTPQAVRFEVEAGGVAKGTRTTAATLERQFLAAGTETRDLTIGESGETCAGRLFLPAASAAQRPLPAVMVLNGSGGGFDLDKAALLSRHGFATLALAYFGAPPLPPWLHRIPLEYFDAALTWLAGQPEIASERIGVIGVSRGAELALLLGSMFPQIRAVAAYAPSHVAWAAGGRDRESGEIIPSWTWQEKPVLFAPLPLRGFMLRSAVPVVALRRPVVFRNLFRAGLRHRAAVERAEIAVERINGPILLVSGGDDHVWPAAKMSEAIVARLKAKRYADHVEHLHFPRAGHMLRYPYLPTTSRRSRNRHLRNARYSFGGIAAADAEAQASAWLRTISFFRDALGAGGGPSE